MNTIEDYLDGRDMRLQISKYENGELPDELVVKLFQTLIDSGLVWKLQGSYGRFAKTLIDQGLCATKN